MSLINKMLRDLDARHVQAGAGRLPKEVRSLPEGIDKRRFARGTWIFVAIAVAAIALLQSTEYWLPTALGLFDAGAPPLAAVPVKLPPLTSLKIAPAPSQAAAEPPAVEELPPPAAPDAPAERSDAAPVAAGAMAPASVETRKGTVAERAAAPDKAQQPRQQSQPTSEPRASLPKPATQSAPPAAPKPARPAAEAPLTVERSSADADRIEDQFRKAASAYQQGRQSEAALQLKAILKESPRHLEARQTLLSMYADQRQWEEVQSLLKEGLSIMPTHIDWAMSLARIQAESGQNEEAWLTLQRHIAYAGERAEYQGFAGVLLHRLKRSSEAAARFRAAARLKPDEGRWWLGLGTALEADGRAGEAREAFARARSSEGLTPDMRTFLDGKLR